MSVAKVISLTARVSEQSLKSFRSTHNFNNVPFQATTGTDNKNQQTSKKNKKQ